MKKFERMDGKIISEPNVAVKGGGLISPFLIQKYDNKTWNIQLCHVSWVEGRQNRHIFSLPDRSRVTSRKTVFSELSNARFLAATPSRMAGMLTRCFCDSVYERKMAIVLT